jgi:hypothetical protein
MGIGVNSPVILPRNSQKLGFDKELRMKSLLESIYTDQKGIYSAEKKSIPNAIYMEIDGAALSQTKEATITMLLPLRTTGTFGNGVAIGSEELPTTKTAKIYHNNCRKVVAEPGYGERQIEADYLKLYPQHIKGLGVWNKDQEDLEIHQGLLETYGETLRHDDTAATCAPNWNANMFIGGLGLNGGHPVYSSNVATYTNRIVAAILASGGGSLTPIVGQTINQSNLSNLSNFALARRITQLDIPGLPGGKGWVLSISELQATYLGDPAWTTRNMGEIYVRQSALNEKLMTWRGAIGAWKNILIVIDDRAATVLPAGSNAPYSLTAGYVWHGDTDLRNRDNPFVRDVATLHGRGAVWKWTPQKQHLIDQLDDYGAIKGVGTADVHGIGGSLIFDQQVPGVATHEQFSSVEVLFGLPDYV